MRILNTILVVFTFLLAYQSMLAQKTLEALRVSEKFTIDGILDEPEWQKAAVATDFIQSSPNVGEPASQRTEVRVIYDDFYLYIGAICYDDMSKISRVLTQRDDFNSNTDYLTFIIDTYNDDQNGFAFGVSSMGVQYDGKLFVADWMGELELAWHSEVKMNDDNWTVEMRIPYSAFRFAKKDEQNWGVNFLRHISRFRDPNSA